MKIVLLAFFYAALAVPAAAQVVPILVKEPEAARLVTAKLVIEQILPASQRDAMVEAMLKPIMANVSQSVATLDFKKLTGSNSIREDVFKRFIDDEQERSLTQAKQAMPLLADAMAKAYARRFTEQQLADLRVFFDTATGRAYVLESMSMMSDPDVMSVQTGMITKSFEGFQERLASFVQGLKSGRARSGS